MMVMRRRGMPLLRGALIGGGAYAMGRRGAQNAQREAEQNAAISDLQNQPQQQQLYAPPAPAAPAAGGSVADQLLQLGQLVQQGLLSQEEFAAAKAKLLG